MTLFYSLTILTLCMLLVALFILYKVADNFKNFILLSGILVFTLVLGLWWNPDLFLWHQHLSQQQAYLQAKKILKQPGKVKELIKRLESQVAHHPDDAKAWFLLGRIYASHNHWTKAHDALFQAYRLEPNNDKTAIFYVETIWQSQGQITDHGRMILEKVLKRDANQPDALIMLAADAKAHQCYQQAIAYWQRILVILPKDSEMAQAITDAIKKAHKKKDNCLIEI